MNPAVALANANAALANAALASAALATQPVVASKKRVYKKRQPKQQQRPCGDGSLSLADLNIDALELIANQLDTEHFIALYLALPKGLWTADALVERRLMRKPDIMLFNRAAQLFSFLGTIEPQYLNRLCYNTYIRLCVNPIHSADRVNLFQTMLADHTKLFNTPGSIRQAKADFKQFDLVRRSAYLSKALRYTWMYTYKKCKANYNTASSLVRHLDVDLKRPVLFGPEKLTLVQAMSTALISHKCQTTLTRLILHLSSSRITFRLDPNMESESVKNYMQLKDNLSHYLKLRHGEFKLFIKLVVMVNLNWSLNTPYERRINRIYAFLPYDIIFEDDIKYRDSVEAITRKWCKYLSVEHVPNDYSAERITTLWRLTREKEVCRNTIKKEKKDFKKML